MWSLTVAGDMIHLIKLFGHDIQICSYETAQVAHVALKKTLPVTVGGEGGCVCVCVGGGGGGGGNVQWNLPKLTTYAPGQSGQFRKVISIKELAILLHGF